MNKQFPNLLFYLLLCFVLLSNHSINAQSVAINEVMASNATSISDEDDDHEDWIELYNYGSTSINLAGYGLSDNSESPFKWVFPSVTIGPDKFLLIFASGKNRTTPGKPLHSNFSINASGEEIILTSASGTIIDSLSSTSIPADYSYGRLPNGTGKWFYYTESTPNAPNSSNVTVHPPEPPVFSSASGFYTEGFTLTLSHPHPNATIVYTIDGSDPSAANLSGVSYSYKNQYPEIPGQEYGQLLTNSYTSNTYHSPLAITDRSTSANKLANISSTWHYYPDYIPENPIKKATVVRAIALIDGVASKIKTHTYFVSSTSIFSGSLPIVSININEDALFDYTDGIYVAGRDFDNWRDKNPTVITNQHRPANYKRTGKATEKSASFQFFVDGNEVINQQIGLRLHGAFSRAPQNKTLRLYARSEYDTQNTFDYPFFGPGNSGSFKRLLLRNSGNDVGNVWIGNALVHTISPAVYFRDAFIHKMVAHLRIDIQDYTPVITYINGEYWGLLNMRERYDKYYLERMYGIQETELEVLEGNASVKIGSNSHYNNMRNFISNNNMSNSERYNYVKTLMDIDNFIDYQITEIYARNTDWPGNNIEYFRKKTDQYEPDSPYGQDGRWRWRWLMFDTDHGFGWSGGESYTHNSLQIASNGNNWSTVILNKLLENQEFRNEFINRYADLLNSAFLPERLINMINDMAGKISDEIPLHQARWNTLPDWEENVALMCNFAALRPEYARTHIRDKFNISRNITAILNVSAPEHGHIQINTIEITDKTPGIPANTYPWSGIYFHNIPLSVKAIPGPGYKFSHWTGASNSSEAAIIITPTNNFTLKANFAPLQDNDYDLLYFWLVDNTVENDKPLSSLNSTYHAGNVPANISFLSSLGDGYPFDVGHQNWRNGSMERRNAPTPVNYFPKANYNLEYGRFDMKAIQIKAPFIGEGAENTLIVSFSTQNYENIKFSFAASTEGSANKLKIDYYDAAAKRWINTNIMNSNPDLASVYQQHSCDFSSVETANNNSDFKIRIRFAGTDLIQDNDNRVTFNNIAIQGVKINPSDTDTVESINNHFVFVYPNPTINHINIVSDPTLRGSIFIVYDLNGKRYLSGKLFEENTIVELSHLPPGVYLLNLKNSTNSVFKIMKQ